MRLEHSAVSSLGLAIGIVLVAASASPSHADSCELLDSGAPRPQSLIDRMPECGGTAPAPLAAQGSSSLTTLFATDNAGSATGGVYFDLEAVGPNDVTITSWDANLDSAFVGNASVWYRAGTYSGHETSAAGWNLVGTATGVTSAGTDSATSLNVGQLTIPSGTTYGIAITLTPTSGTVGHRYTNGSQTYNNGALELRAGTATNVAFTAPLFSSRIWNGTVHYQFGVSTCSSYQVQVSTGQAIVAGSTNSGNHGDDLTTPLALPFYFPFYDQEFSFITVGSNGTSGFVSNGNAFTNVCLPVTAINYAILPYWDDLRTDIGTGCASYPGGVCGIFTSVSGVAPNRIVNIEWRAVYFNASSTQAHFEVRLHETTGQVDLVYGTLANGIATATGGIQQGTGTSFESLFCNASGQSVSAGSQATFTYDCAGNLIFADDLEDNSTDNWSKVFP